MRCSAASTCWSGTVAPWPLPASPSSDPDRHRVEIGLRVESPGQVAGLQIDAPTVLRRLVQVGCTVRGADVLTVTPPSWRPDLTDPADLVEEVVRLVGYDRMPVGAAHSAARSRAGR